jgi:hypothetical protein
VVQWLSGHPVWAGEPNSSKGPSANHAEVIQRPSACDVQLATAASTWVRRERAAAWSATITG